FKMEAMDGILGNAAILHNAGVRTIIHSDDASGSQRLNQEAAKAMHQGRRLGFDIPIEEAIRWITINAAWAIELHDRVGSLEPGKNADLVLWTAEPFSVSARDEKVWVDGAMMFDRDDPSSRWRTDFEVGFVPAVTQLEGGAR